jgi:hypothetical protein
MAFLRLLALPVATPEILGLQKTWIAALSTGSITSISFGGDQPEGKCQRADET